MENLKNIYVEDYTDTKNYLRMIERSGLSKFSPLIISCAITGGNQGKESNPNLPETIDEQVQQSYDAYNAGASIVHIHGRGPEQENMGYNTKDPRVYKEINYRVREKCPELIINNTAIHGRWWSSDGVVTDTAMHSISAKPEIASIDITNYAAAVIKKKRPEPLKGIEEDYLLEANYVISPRDISEGIEIMKSYGVKPEYEMFTLQDIHFLNDLIREKQVEEPHWVSMVFGALFNYPNAQTLINTMSLLPPKTLLNVITTGAAQFPFITLAMIMGCHVRVGMEDNYYLSKGRLAESNAQLVEKIVRIAKEVGRPIATPAQARKMLGLGEPRKYDFPEK